MTRRGYYGRRTSNMSKQTMVDIDAERRAYRMAEQKKFEEEEAKREAWKAGKQEVDSREAEQIVKNGGTIGAYIYGSEYVVKNEGDHKFVAYRDGEFEDVARFVTDLEDWSNMGSLCGYFVMA